MTTQCKTAAHLALEVRFKHYDLGRAARSAANGYARAERQIPTVRALLDNARTTLAQHVSTCSTCATEGV